MGKKLGSGIHINPLTNGVSTASPYATAQLVVSSSSGSSSSKSDWMASYKHLHLSPFKQQNAPQDSSYYAEVPSPSSDLRPTAAEDWIEVTNKANQTPSHWVYSDMISGNSELVYPMTSGNNSMTYVASNYSMPKDMNTLRVLDSGLGSSVTTSANNSPMLNRGRSHHHHHRPQPPSYQYHLYQNSSRVYSPLLSRVFQQHTNSSSLSKEANPECFADIKKSKACFGMRMGLADIGGSVDSGKESFCGKPPPNGDGSFHFKIHDLRSASIRATKDTDYL